MTYLDGDGDLNNTMLYANPHHRGKAEISGQWILSKNSGTHKLVDRGYSIRVESFIIGI